MNYVLWLSSWYPSRVQPSNGDFVQRHAECVSMGRKVIVLHVEKDDELGPGETEIIESERGSLVEIRVYYGRSKWGGWLGKLKSLTTFKKIQRVFYDKICAKYGEPSLIHVHESMKAGLLAINLKQERGIPYILTTHWTGYQTKFTPNYTEQTNYWNRLNRSIIKNASMITTVSMELGRAMEKYAGPLPLKCIYNVVNTNNFFRSSATPKKFRFVHASYLNTQKNPEGIIEAAAFLQKDGWDFELVLIGRECPEMIEMAIQKGMQPTNIINKPAIAHEQMPEELRSASSLLMFSRFENMPCILLEALCSGLPVISSNVGGIAEVIDRSNGILVESENVKALEEAMKEMMREYSRYDRTKIALEASNKFSYEIIAKEFDSLYRSMETS